jgi:6-pyruvoyltetrahydropterin/6-carboxytetrahydropterin synthase
MIYKLEGTFSCAHFYKQDQWSDSKNQQEFGKCFTDYGHGHDYTLEVEIKSEQLSQSQIDFKNIINEIDHQHLNFVVPEFKTQIPTTENLALYLKEKLQNSFNKHQTKIESLKLLETPEIWVEISSS